MSFLKRIFGGGRKERDKLDLAEAKREDRDMKKDLAEAKREDRDVKKQGLTEIDELIAKFDKYPNCYEVKEVIRFGEAAVEPLLEALQSDNDTIVENSAVALGKIGDERAVEPLIELHKNKKSFKAKMWAATALCRIGDPYGVPALISIPIQTPSIALTLAKTGEVDALIEALKSEDYRSRANVKNALIEIGDSAIEPLIAALDDEDQDLCRVISILIRVGDERAVEPLSELHENSPNKRIREAAGRFLGKFGDPRAIPTLIDQLGIRNHMGQVISGLVAIGPAAVEPVIASLEATIGSNKYTTPKDHHIEVLGRIGDPRAVDVLKALTAPDKEDRLRTLALEALSKLDQPLEISQEEIASLKDSLLSNDYNARKNALARAQLIAGSVDDAELQRAFEASGKLQEAYDNQRKALSGNEPMQACHEAVELEPGFSAAYVCLSYLHCEYAKKPKDGVKWAEKAIQIDPKNAGAWAALGKAHVALGDAPEAARAFHQVVTMEPQYTNLEPLARLVAVYRKLDMQDLLGDAIIRLNRAGAGLDPDHEREWEQMVLAANKEQLREVILE